MKNIICVSQKKNCAEDYFVRVKKIFQAQPFAFILREKELNEQEYRALALDVCKIARNYAVPLFLNGNFSLACELGLGTQLSFCSYQMLEESPVPIGISIHSKEEAEYIMQTPKRVFISHIIAGHIFMTDCKKGLAPRGVDFLASVCTIVAKRYPVFGIGGISPNTMPLLFNAGASGGAIMSSCMATKNFGKLVQNFSQYAEYVES